jgi:hypothetical protein
VLWVAHSTPLFSFFLQTSHNNEAVVPVISLDIDHDKDKEDMIEECFDQEAVTDATPPPPHQKKLSHFQRQDDDLSWYWRMGIPLYLVATLALLLASDIGSGIQAITKTIPAETDIWSQPKTTVIADESIFTSVDKLWQTKSYALAIFLVLCSIAWPYIKLLMTLYAWMAPFVLTPRAIRRRERLLEVLDVLGKWSFADVFVFCEILVAFRYVSIDSTI